MPVAGAYTKPDAVTDDTLLATLLLLGASFQHTDLASEARALRDHAAASPDWFFESYSLA